MRLLDLFFGWDFVCSGDCDWVKGGKVKINDKRIPPWLRSKRYSFQRVGVTYNFKGNHFQYKVLISRPGQQGSTLAYEIFKRER